MIEIFKFSGSIDVFEIHDNVEPCPRRKNPRPAPFARHALNYGLDGAVLADLAWAGKIDADQKRLTVLDPSPAGGSLLPWIPLIPAEKNVFSVANWLFALAERRKEIEHPALDRLMVRGTASSQASLAN